MPQNNVAHRGFLLGKQRVNKIHLIKIHHHHLDTDKAILLLMKHFRKNKGLLVSKKGGKNAVKSHKITFSKSQKLLTEHLHERQPIQNIW